MASESRDLLLWILPLGLIALLGAAYVGVVLAKASPQAKSTPAATSSPSPSPTITTAPTTKATSTDAAKAQTAPTGWMKLKESMAGCQPGFDTPDGSKQQVACFLPNQAFATAGEEKNGYTALTSGPNKFWIETQFLEPVQQPDPIPSPRLPPQPEANWN